MFKWLFRIVILAIVAFLLVGVIAYFNMKAKEPPDVESASYAIQTYYAYDGEKKIPSRIYYAENIEIHDGKAIITDYWRYDGDKYHRINDTKEIPPPYDIIRRGQQ